MSRHLVRTDNGHVFATVSTGWSDGARHAAEIELAENPLQVRRSEAERLINALAETFDIPLEIRGGCVVSGAKP